jgi:competence ComEA-like helix-hairpin-helix protein
MNDSAFNAMKPYIKVEQNNLLKLNINTTSDFELGSHPYINKTIAKAIVVYRNQHGNYQSINDLRKIVFIKDSVLQKISPYLTVE